MIQKVKALGIYNSDKISDNKIRNILIGLYILIILGISASARADVSIFPISGQILPEQIHSFKGEVAVSVDGDSYLVISDKEFYELASSENVNLTQYNGETVVVKGFEIVHKSGPVLSLQAIDPLDGEYVGKRVAPVLVVLGISEVAK